jgi:hypothetical protein
MLHIFFEYVLPHKISVTTLSGADVTHTSEIRTVAMLVLLLGS